MRAAFIFLALCINSVFYAQTQCPLPYAQFTFTLATDGYTVVFNVNDCNPDYIYDWTFGNGASYHQTDSQADPTHTYGEDGVYLVTMTVSLPAPCTATYTQTAEITINHSSPSSMWLDLSGPTLAGECQQVSFNAQVTGGVPPYVYTWNMGGSDCPDCSIPCNPRGDFVGVSNETATFSETGFFSNPICVTVTDANGNSEYKCLDIKVKEFIYPIEININGTKGANGNCYIPNSNIIFLPDIDPLSSFEYPTNYYWEFGDGTSYLDNIDGGGFTVHTYPTPPSGSATYNVKLTVSDPNGSMQVTKPIIICGAGGSGGGCRLEISSMPQGSTITMDYAGPASNWPSEEYFDYINEAQPSCTNPIYRWDISMPTCGLSGLLIGETEFNGIQIGSGFPITVGNDAWYTLTNGYKAWGCLKMICTESGTDHLGNACTTCTKGNACIAYILPDEFILSDIEITGECRTYDLLAHAEGGGWKLEGGGQKYKNYTWKAFDTYNHDQEIDVLVPAPGNPKDRMRINLDHPYFKQFGPEQYVEFMVKLIVEDYANNILETNQLISFNPFRLHLQDEYTRCPGVESHFSEKPLATGGSEGPYDFIWSGGLSGENPIFIAPQQGSVSYALTVSDGSSCTLTKTISITATPLTLDLPNITWPVCSTGGREVGPIEPENLGGSGHYTFFWSPSNYLSDVNISNPLVSGIPDGQTIPYTLIATDIYGGCTSSDNIAVTGVANDHTVSLNGPGNICYGEEIVLNAQGSPVYNTPPLGDIFHFYQWTTTNPHHDLSGLGNYVNNLPIDEIVASHPGTYTYTVRYKYLVTGCFAEATKSITIRQPWKHNGYTPAIKSVVQGTSVPLWEGDNNVITSGIANMTSGIEVTWWPAPPTSITYNTGSASALPKNGMFTPTTAAPYLIMTVKDKATGCSKSYKTMRYVISEITPKLWATASNTFTCVGGEVCFDVVFDAQLANYQTSLPPTSIKLGCAIHANVAQQPPSKYYAVELFLVNSSGLYRGKFCEQDFFQNQTNYSQPYRLDISLVSSIWGYISGPSIDLLVINPTGLTNNNIECLPINVNNGKENALLFEFGVECAGVNTVHLSSSSSMAGDYIEIYPDGDIELIPSNSQGINFGALLAINPCIEAQFNASDPKEFPEPPVTADRKDKVKPAATSAEVTLEVFPNPFSGEVRIRCAIPPNCGDWFSINLLDIAGKHLRLIGTQESSIGGQFDFVFDGKDLAPGVYFYELSAGNCRKIKKAVKISNH